MGGLPGVGEAIQVAVAGAGGGDGGGRAEDFQTGVIGIADQDPTEAVHGNPQGDAEFARRAAVATQASDEDAVGREHGDCGLEGVHHTQLPVAAECDAADSRQPAGPTPKMADGDRTDALASGGVDENLVCLGVAHVHAPGGRIHGNADGKPAGNRQHGLVGAGIEDPHRPRLAVGHIDTPPGDGEVAGRGKLAITLAQRRPVTGDGEGIHTTVLEVPHIDHPRGPDGDPRRRPVQGNLAQRAAKWRKDPDRPGPGIRDKEVAVAIDRKALGIEAQARAEGSAGRGPDSLQQHGGRGALTGRIRHRDLDLTGAGKRGRHPRYDLRGRRVGARQNPRRRAPGVAERAPLGVGSLHLKPRDLPDEEPRRRGQQRGDLRRRTAGRGNGEVEADREALGGRRAEEPAAIPGNAGHGIDPRGVSRPFRRDPDGRPGARQRHGDRRRTVRKEAARGGEGEADHRPVVRGRGSEGDHGTRRGRVRRGAEARHQRPRIPQAKASHGGHAKGDRQQEPGGKPESDAWRLSRPNEQEPQARSPAPPERAPRRWHPEPFHPNLLTCPAAPRASARAATGRHAYDQRQRQKCPEP